MPSPDLDHLWHNKWTALSGPLSANKNVELLAFSLQESSNFFWVRQLKSNSRKSEIAAQDEIQSGRASDCIFLRPLGIGSVRFFFVTLKPDVVYEP